MIIKIDRTNLHKLMHNNKIKTQYLDCFSEETQNTNCLSCSIRASFVPMFKIDLGF